MEGRGLKTLSSINTSTYMQRRFFLKYLALGAAGLVCHPNEMYASTSDLQKSSKIKPIVGSWIEFQHHSEEEGGGWNKHLAKFTKEQWRRKIFEMKEIGMEYLVLMSVASGDKAFYPSKLAPKFQLGCDDPVEAVLSAADECGIKFFVSNDFWGNLNAYEMMLDKEVQKKRFQSMEELTARYAHHTSFYGWYFPNEAQLQPYFIDACVDYVNKCAEVAQSLTPNCVNLIAPYFIKEAKFDDYFVSQLEKMNIDIIAYQDGVGVNHTQLEDSARFFEILYKAHEKASRARLWADMELFYFEKGDRGNLLPADFNKRIIKQMENISPYVDKILCYQYIGIMNKPGTNIIVGPYNETTKLYNQYLTWYTDNINV
jgi:hypothetical protein